MKHSARTIAFWLTLLTGLGLLFIGARFLISPLQAEAGFGIHVPVQNNYAFHYIKGIRDFFTGAIITLLLLKKEYRALGFLLLLGSMIPVVDGLIVYARPDHETGKLFPHITAIVLGLILGMYYLLTKQHDR